MAESSYVNMTELIRIGNYLVDSAGPLGSMSGDLSSASGEVTKGWNDDQNSATYAQKFGQFIEETNKLIAEISKYGSFLKEAAGTYSTSQSGAMQRMGE
jgi:hypothetical protein